MRGERRSWQRRRKKKKAKVPTLTADGADDDGDGKQVNLAKLAAEPAAMMKSRLLLSYPFVRRGWAVW